MGSGLQVHGLVGYLTRTTIHRLVRLGAFPHRSLRVTGLRPARFRLPSPPAERHHLDQPGLGQLMEEVLYKPNPGHKASIWFP